jgi:hypothetical protein
MSYTKYFSAWACLVSIILCSCSSKQARFIKITNPLNIERADELVVLKRADIESQIGKIPGNKYARIIAGDKSLPAQYDDMNGDGVWDELVSLRNDKFLTLGFSLFFQSRRKCESESGIVRYSSGR